MPTHAASVSLESIVHEVRRLAEQGMGRDRIAKQMSQTHGPHITPNYVGGIMSRNNIRAANLPRIEREKVRLIVQTHEDACRRGEQITDLAIAAKVRAVGISVTDETVRLVLGWPASMVRRMLAEDAA